jgi:hypothetical protein
MSGHDDGRDVPDDVDELLRRALRDDLPEEVEQRLRARVERFVVECRQQRGGRWLTAVQGWVRGLVQLPMPWPSREAALALSSLLLAISGFVLQGVSGPNAFASSLTRASVSSLLSREVRHASGVDVRVRVRAHTGTERACRIAWTSPAQSRADARSAVEECPGAAMPLLSASRLADRIYRDWGLLESSPLPRSGELRLRFRDAEEPAEYEVTADARAVRPRVIRRFRLGSPGEPESRFMDVEAELTWQPGADSRPAATAAPEAS